MEVVTPKVTPRRKVVNSMKRAGGLGIRTYCDRGSVLDI